MSQEYYIELYKEIRESSGFSKYGLYYRNYIAECKSEMLVKVD